MNRIALTVSLASLAAAASSAHAVVSFFDGVFNNSDWTLNTITNASGTGSTVQALQFLTGGNPNEYRRIRNNLLVGSTGNGAVIGFHMNVTAFYTPSSQGAITSINYSEDSINFVNQGGNGQGSGLAILQNGIYYRQQSPILVMPFATFSSWAPNAAPGLTATSFAEVTPAGIVNIGNNPDFSATGSIMQLGFWRGNSANQNFNTDCGIDNWHVDIIPAPGATALLGLGGLVALRRRR
jgi:hypothetical protein